MSKKFIVYLAIIVAVTYVIYYPSFHHLLRGETYTYFMDSMNSNSVFSLVGNYYNYEMVRVFDAGDSLAFRPLLFSTLGIEKALFGIDYTYWRIAALLTHLIATLCLFRLLWKIRPTIIAFFATLFFSTSIFVVSAVLYEQIATSYTLVMALFLTAFYYIYCGVNSGKTKHLILAALSMLIACFFLEIGIVVTILLIGYFWLERKHPNFKWRRWVLVFTAIIVVYIASYTAETFINPTSTTDRDFNHLVRTENINKAFSDGNRLATYWMTQFLKPSEFTAEIDTNYRANAVSILPTFVEWMGYTGTEIITYRTNKEGTLIPVIFNYIAIAIIGGALFLKPRRAKFKPSAPFLFMLTVVPFVLALVNAFYRGLTVGLLYLLSDANYNIYFWMGLSIVTIYAFISLKELKIWHKGLISLALIILILLTAPLTYRINKEVREDAEPIRLYFQEIDNFIESFRPEDEPDFSFSSTINSSDQEERMGILLWKGNPYDETGVPHYLTMPQVLYWRYWDNTNPKYTLIYHSEEDVLEVIKND